MVTFFCLPFGHIKYFKSFAGVLLKDWKLAKKSTNSIQPENLTKKEPKLSEIFDN